MEARMNQPAMVVPGAMEALESLSKAIKVAAHKNGLSSHTINLVNMRASQINGCSMCLYLHTNDARKLGETDDRLLAVAAWRESPLFSEAERAVLALTEAATRLSDRGDQVPDEIWQAATRHYKETALATLVLGIASINLWNRLNVTTRQVAGSWAA